MGVGRADINAMRKRRLKQRICNKAFLLEFTVLVLTIVLFILLVESYWDTSLSPSGKFQYGRWGSLRDKIQQLSLVGLSPNQECKVPRFEPTTKPNPRAVCKRVKPLWNSCDIATKLFFSSPTDTCSHQTTHEICEMKDAKGKPTVKCSASICKSSIVLGTIDVSQGILVWTKIVDIIDLEAHIQSLMEQPPEKPNFGFCFIKCSLEEEEEVVIEQKEEVDEEDRNLFGGMLAEMEELEEESDVNYIYQDSDVNVLDETRVKQLLLLPPQIDTSDLPNLRRTSGVNINVILLDSVSHSHFLRSMPATVQSLKRIHKEKSGHVFSYNLMQSLKGRTYETEQALFSGMIYNPKKPFGVQDMPPEPIHTEALLKRYKHGGYETLWSEDLCWTWEWGLVKNILAHQPKEKIHDRWKIFQDALKKAGIDRLDMTLSSCEVLKANDHKDPFHGPSAICYNGKYQHNYILSYLADLQKQLKKVEKQFFHYMEINVAHDDYGRRIQTLDEDLANYFQSISNQENMLTILFADHGNAYGQFFKKTDEARLEMYHPVLTILASKNIPQLLGEKKMQALTVNQDRLVSILDLHYALQTLAPGGPIAVATEHAQYDVEPMGLLAPIDVNRSCNSIPRIHPNMCICEDFDTYVANNTRQMMVAEFALGEINNAIQSQFRTAHPEAETGFGSCQRLVATWFSNVQESHYKDTITTKLDIHVPAGKNASQDDEVFFVIVQTFTSKPNLMSLLSYERISSYSQYEACKDEGVNTKLCICALNQPISKPDYMTIPSWHLNYPVVFGHKSMTESVNNCLYVYERRTKSGITLEASLACTKNFFVLEVDADILTNVHTSVPLPSRVRVNPGDMVFLIVFMQNRPVLEWKVEYTIKYEQSV